MQSKINWNTIYLLDPCQWWKLWELRWWIELTCFLCCGLLGSVEVSSRLDLGSDEESVSNFRFWLPPLALDKFIKSLILIHWTLSLTFLLVVFFRLFWTIGMPGCVHVDIVRIFFDLRNIGAKHWNIEIAMKKTLKFEFGRWHQNNLIFLNISFR